MASGVNNAVGPPRRAPGGRTSPQPRRPQVGRARRHHRRLPDRDADHRRALRRRRRGRLPHRPPGRPRSVALVRMARRLPHMSHWDAYRVTVDGAHRRRRRPSGRPGAVADPAELPRRHRPRHGSPAGSREGRLDTAPGRRPRGTDDFVEVPWDEALDLVAPSCVGSGGSTATSRSSAAPTGAGSRPAVSTTPRTSATGPLHHRGLPGSVNSYSLGASEGTPLTWSAGPQRSSTGPRPGWPSTSTPTSSWPSAA